MIPGVIDIAVIGMCFAVVMLLWRDHTRRSRFSSEVWQQQMDDRSIMVADLTANHLKSGMLFVDVVSLLGSPANPSDSKYEHLSRVKIRHTRLAAWPLWSDTPCNYLVVHFDDADCVAESSYILID